ncbi:MAG: SURF1 family protein [Acidimicrobiia bacterium]
MDRRLLSPGMLATHLAVLAVAALFIRLGIWQLDRLEERREENAVASARLEMPSVDIARLLAEDGDPASLRNRRVTAAGMFDPAQEVLIRSQVYRGSAGFHVITPLLLEDEGAIMVNRGWVPLGFDQVPLAQAPPPGGVVTVEGWLATKQTRPALGPEDPAGRLVVMSRVDLDRIESQLPYSIAPVYLVEMGEREQPPIPVEPPDFTDEGPHLAYAIQWFAFAAIGVVGYFSLLRRRFDRGGRSSRGKPGE